MLTLRAARLFLAAADHGTLTAAAGVQNVSQPAATKTLAQLELDLGGALFTRTGRRLELTDLGAAMLPRARALVQQAEDLRAEADRWTSGEAGRLRVGAGPSMTYRLLPDAVSRFYRSGRTVQLSIRAGAASELVDALCRGGLDLVVADVGEAQADPALSVRLLAAEPLVVLVRPGHPALDGADLSRFPVATATPPRRLEVQPLAWGQARAGLICDDYAVLARACLASDHMLPAPGVTAARLAADHGLVAAPVPDTGMRVHPALIARKGAPESAALEALCTCFEDANRAG